ncbi:hypothetical protein L3Q82_007524 [Scortum barcoo]|uniref:Uncharacterized protein n=1 Tax=Scortum barcoo TaxID=214431 RepID=A0ACB8WNG8_9TELE|nr:hypothetical protein L3Q82_007524 [Scortum barcoo]
MKESQKQIGGKEEQNRGRERKKREKGGEEGFVGSKGDTVLGRRDGKRSKQWVVKVIRIPKKTDKKKMDKVERVMKMVKRMSPRKKRREGGGGRGGGPGELESPDTLCDELCRFSLCISVRTEASVTLGEVHPINYNQQDK